MKKCIICESEKVYGFMQLKNGEVQYFCEKCYKKLKLILPLIKELK